VFGISKITGLDDIGIAIMGNTMCFLWICSFVPLAARQLIERPAAKAKSSKSLCAETFGGLAQTFKEAKRYPQTFKYLIMHLLSSSAVGTVLSQLPTYGKIQLGLGSFEVVVVLAVILICAVPAALVYSYCCAAKLGVKLNQIIIYVYVRRAKRLGYRVAVHLLE
jgi:MFS-type transporter involved in bile tolerance (Atg22 family)